MSHISRAGLAITALLLVGALGVAIPKLAMSDGVVDRPDAERVVAQEAIRFAATCVDNPLQRLYTFRLRVQSVVPDPACITSTTAAARTDGFRAQVTEHTLFGIAFATVTICGSSAMCG